jgi:hypothetical protein
MNFSPFFGGSEGLVASVAFTPSFPGAGVAAHNAPELMKKATENVSQISIAFFNLYSIAPP